MLSSDQEAELGVARKSKGEERQGEGHLKLGTPMGYKTEDFSHCEPDHGGDSVQVSEGYREQHKQVGKGETRSM